VVGIEQGSGIWKQKSERQIVSGADFATASRRAQVNLLSTVPMAWRSPKRVAATNLPEFRLRSWYCTATVTDVGGAAQTDRNASPVRRESSGGAMAVREQGGGRWAGMWFSQRRNALVWSYFYASLVGFRRP